MIAIFNWFILHWQAIVAIYTGLVTVASIYVKLTPTLADDTALLKFTKWVSKYIALARTIDDAAIRNQNNATPQEPA